MKGVAPRNHHVPIANPARAASRSTSWSRPRRTPTSSPAASPDTPLGDKATAGDEPLYRLARADLAVLDEEVWQLTSTSRYSAS